MGDQIQKPPSPQVPPRLWFLVSLGFGEKSLEVERERERERDNQAKLPLLQIPLYSLFKFDTLLCTHNEVFFVVQRAKSQSLVFYIVVFYSQNLIVLLLRIQRLCPFLSSSLSKFLCFPLFSLVLTLKIASDREITHLSFFGFVKSVWKARK